MVLWATAVGAALAAVAEPKLKPKRGAGAGTARVTDERASKETTVEKEGILKSTPKAVKAKWAVRKAGKKSGYGEREWTAGVRNQPPASWCLCSCEVAERRARLHHRNIPEIGDMCDGTSPSDLCP